MASRVRVAVMHHRIRHIGALPSRPAGTEPEVGVFAIQKKVVVEAPYLVEHGATVKRRRPTRQQHRIGASKQRRGLKMPALLATAVAANQHAGGVDASVRMQPHLRGAHANCRIGVSGAEKGGNPIRLCIRIVVKSGDERGIRGSYPLIDSCAETHVLRVFNHGSRAPFIPDELAGAVVDDHNLDVLTCLRVEGAHAFIERGIGGKSWNYDGHACLLQPSSLRQTRAMLVRITMPYTPETDLRYPIGKFQPTATPLSSEQRAELIADLAGAPLALRTAVRGLSDEQLNTPYRPGGWTVRQTVHHVADSHLHSYLRFKFALTEDEPTIKTYDEAAWAELPDNTLPVEVSLALLEPLHERWATFLRALRPEQWQRKFRHPERGLVELDGTLAIYAWHGRHHVAHITELRKRLEWN